MIILTQTFDLVTWLLPQCEHFPKSQRFVITQRMQDALLDFQEALYAANARSGLQRLDRLQAADAYLDTLRLYLRLARLWNWMGSGQHAHVSRMVAEIGKLLGGWLRQTAASVRLQAGPEGGPARS